jgi:hypothetical protein
MSWIFGGGGGGGNALESKMNPHFTPKILLTIPSLGLIQPNSSI